MLSIRLESKHTAVNPTKQTREKEKPTSELWCFLSHRSNGKIATVTFLKRTQRGILMFLIHFLMYRWVLQGLGEIWNWPERLIRHGSNLWFWQIDLESGLSTLIKVPMPQTSDLIPHDFHLWESSFPTPLPRAKMSLPANSDGGKKRPSGPRISVALPLTIKCSFHNSTGNEILRGPLNLFCVFNCFIYAPLESWRRPP